MRSTGLNKVHTHIIFYWVIWYAQSPSLLEAATRAHVCPFGYGHGAGRAEVKSLCTGSAKLTGSGGAVIALFMTDDVNIEKIRNQYEAEGYTMVKAEIASAGAPDAASF